MIAPIIIDETSSSPAVILDSANNRFSLKGRSLLEDSFKFYKPIINWMEEYSKNPNPSTVFEINMEYINSSTTKHLVRLLMYLEDIYKRKNEVKVIWKYLYEDDLMLQRASELDYAIEVPFEIQSYED